MKRYPVRRYSGIAWLLHLLRMMMQTPHQVQAGMLDVDLSDGDDHYPLSLFNRQKAQLTIDIDACGRQHGFLNIPRDSDSGYLPIPVCCLKGQKPGPTVTLLGGVHGDEYEGTVALQKLARTLEPDSLNGRLIIVPTLNPSAQRSGVRNSPLDNKNLDTCFPGNDCGTISDRLAFHALQKLLEPADLVLDIRSGGSQWRFIPLAAVRQPSCHERQDECESAMIAFGAPNCVRFPADSPHYGLHSSVSDRQKIYVQTELGGASDISAETLEIATTGCLNVLRQWKILDEPLELRASRMLEVPADSYYIHAPVSGLLEPHARLGQDIWKGDPLLSLVNAQQTGQAPVSVPTPHNAVLLGLHRGGHVEAGELIAILANEVQR